MARGFLIHRTRLAAPVLGAALLAAPAMLAACKRAELPPEEALRQRGRTLYTLHCASCHHPSNPARDGSLGPALAGSSLDLLDAKLNRGEYPADYVPKRETRVMQRLPMSGEDLEALRTFLAAVPRSP